MIFFKNKNKKQPAAESSAAGRYWGRYFFIALIIFIAVIALIIYKFAQKPAQGVIKPQDSDAQGGKKEEEVPKPFSGKNLSFLYGSSYVLKSHEIAKDSSQVILEQAYLS